MKHISLALSLFVTISSAFGEFCETKPRSSKPLTRTAYFENLREKGMSAPIEDFLVLWDSSQSEFDSDPYFFACENRPWGALKKFTKINGTKYLEDKCKPDVLYSWAEDVKVANISKHLQDDLKWQGPANPFLNSEYSHTPGYEGGRYENLLYMALTPAITFGYGTTLLRFKFKKGLPFVNHPKKDPGPGEVGFTPIDDMPDFAFSDSSVVESWSYGTSEIYDEIVRDLIRLKSDKRTQIYGRDYTKKGLSKIYYGSGDNKEFDENTLKRNLINLIDQILKNEGKVFYQKGSCRNYDEHYKTSLPTWFNPR